MQRHFSSRAEAHAETVAAKMNARRRPVPKLVAAAPSRRNVPAVWQPRVATLTVADVKKTEAKATDKLDLGERETPGL